MSVHYPFLIFALLLLWFPRGWLRYGLRVTPRPPRRINQAKIERDPHDRAVKPFVEAAKSRNWVDLARGAVGAFGISAAVFTPPDVIGIYTPLLLIQAGILTVAVLCQMLRLERKLSLFAPIFFLQGMAIGVNGLLVGFLAMLGSWALSPMLPTPGAFVFVHGCLVLCLGLLFESATPSLLLVLCGVIWLPPLLAVLMKKRLSASFDKRLKVVPRGTWGDRDGESEDDAEREGSGS